LQRQPNGLSHVGQASAALHWKQPMDNLPKITNLVRQNPYERVVEVHKICEKIVANQNGVVPAQSIPKAIQLTSDGVLVNEHRFTSDVLSTIHRVNSRQITTNHCFYQPPQTGLLGYLSFQCTQSTRSM
jgi:hypothetical protein